MAFEEELAFALELARAGGAVAMGHFGTALSPEKKRDGTWVTEADRAVETELRRMIAKRFPKHNILGEEEGLSSAGGGEATPDAPTWIVDPIDGTNNFMSGIPIWATLVALRDGDRSVVGVCHAPAIGETYDASVGNGARMNDEAIHVDADTKLTDAVTTFSSVQSFYEMGLTNFLTRLVTGSWRSRGFGDFWGHMLVARGAADVMVEPILNLWDVAPLEPIVTEAGGRITDERGAPWTEGQMCITTCGSLHDEVVRLARGTRARGD